MKKFRTYLLVTLALLLALLCGCNVQQPPVTETQPPLEFDFYTPEVMELPDSQDVDVMILDCDSDEDFIHKSNVWVTNTPGEYVQGTGALAMGNIMGFQAYVNFEKVDISSCKEGSIHLSIYMDKEDFDNAQMVIELNSSGSIDIDEICWFVPTRELNVGWNDLYLNIADCRKTGEMLFEEVQYIRIFTQNSAPGQKFIVDNIYACEESVEEDKKVQVPSATANPGYLVSFDSLVGVHSNCRLYPMTSKEDCQEGNGAVLLNSEDNRGMWIQANFAPTDISAYQEGLVSVWVYVRDREYMKGENLFVELTSSGTYDQQELSWQIPNETIKNGWNLLRMPLASAHKTGEIDLAQVNYLRIHLASVNPGLIMMFDGVQVGNITPVVPENGMILDCDSTENMTVKQTINEFNVSGSCKQGSGSFSNTGTAADRIAVIRHIPVDISAYKDGGLHLWMYVEDVSALTQNVAIELGSAGSPDKNELQWWYPTTLLQNGWNEIELFFADAYKSEPEIDFGSVKWFRVYCNASRAINFKFDDVRAVMEPKTQEVAGTLPVLLWSADGPAGLSLYERNTYSFTQEEGFFKQGTGAYKNEGSTTEERLVAKFQPAVNISAFPDAALHMWLHVDNVENIGGRVMIELGSGNGADVDEYQWSVYSTVLQNGWNELTLNFSAADETGTVDLSRINWFRIFTGSRDPLVMLVDDVSVVESTVMPEPEQPDTSRVVLWDCEKLTASDVAIYPRNTISITTAEGEVKVGTAAYKNSGNTHEERIVLKFNPKKDASAIENGALHLWLHLEDITKLTGNVYFELGSGNGADVDEYQWSLFPSSFQNGWNEVILPFAFADVTGAPNLAKLDWFRMFTSRGVDLTVIVDDISVVEAPETEELPTDPSQPEVTSVTLWNADDQYEPGVAVYNRNTITITTAEGEVKEGTAAYKNVGSTNEERIVLKFNPVKDASAIENGALHLWLHLEDITKLTGNVYFELGSGNGADVDEYQWSLFPSSLQNGWNELILPFADGVVTGTPDASALNWMRMFTSTGVDLTVIIDDISVVEAPETEEEPTVPGESEPAVTSVSLWNGDNQYEPGVAVYNRNTITITTAEGEVKEGAAAYKNSGSTHDERIVLKFNPAKDASAIENGALHLWLHIDDITKLTGNVYFELGSGNGADVDEYQWSIPASSFHNPWNQLILPLSSGDVTGNPDAAALNWFRMYTSSGVDLTVIVDDISIVDLSTFEPEEPTTPDVTGPDVTEPGVTEPAVTSVSLWNGDNQYEPGVAVYNRNTITITTAEGEVKEGTAAYKNSGSTNEERIVLKFNPAKDASAIENGALHLWLHLDDVTKLTGDVRIELGSGNAADVDEYQWLVLKSNLQTGWNELILPFTDGVKTGTPNASALNWFRMYTSAGVDLTVIIDDISVVEAPEAEEEPTVPGESEPAVTSVSLWNGDNQYEPGVAVYNRNTITITTAEGEVKEGAAAYKNSGNTHEERIVLKFNPAKDASAIENGALHMWLHLDDVTKLTGDVRIELGSGNGADVDEYQWLVLKSNLQTGWNELILPFTDGVKTGTPNASALNWFRMYTSAGVDLTVIIDDISVVEDPDAEPEEPTEPEETEPEAPSVAIWSCDSKDGMAVYKKNTITYTSAINEFKEGAAAYKNIGTGADRLLALISNRADASEFADNGALNMWLYIDDVSKLTSAVTFELSSSNKADTDEYQWDVPAAQLQSGWNEVTLSFADATQNGTVDLSSLFRIRISTSDGANLTMIVDAIKIVVKE